MFITNIIRVFLTAVIVKHEPSFGESCMTDSCSVSVRFSGPWHKQMIVLNIKTHEVSNRTDRNCFNNLVSAVL